MQMRKQYESTNRKVQASNYRRAGAAAAKAGYSTIAEVNFAMAALTEPPKMEEVESDGESDMVRNTRQDGGAAAGSGVKGRNVPNLQATTERPTKSSRAAVGRPCRNQSHAASPRLSAA